LLREKLAGLGRLSTILTVIVVVGAILCGCEGQQETKKELQLGDPAPDFAIKTLSGEVAVLSSLRGRPVILRFFETGCRFCRADTPAFNRFYTKHKDNGLYVLYIGSFYESRVALEKFIEELQLDFPVAMDEGAKLADLYGVKAYPQTIFIGPQGQLLAALLGGVGEPEMEEIFAEYLKDK